MGLKKSFFGLFIIFYNVLKITECGKEERAQSHKFKWTESFALSVRRRKKTLKNEEQLP